MSGDILQYGALGLCAILVVFLVFYILRQQKREDEIMARYQLREDELRKKLLEISNKMVGVLDAFRYALETRPCLKDDRIFKDGTLRGDTNDK
jgi:hypothetical protein